MPTASEEIRFGRALEACAQGLSVHETLEAVAGFPPSVASGSDPLTPEQAGALVAASAAVCDVAGEMYAQGLDPDDLDPSWVRLYGYLSHLGGRPPRD